MKVLVIGGTGALGGHAALHLAAAGHDVSISGRGTGAHPGSALTSLGYLRGDYVKGDFTAERLAGFDWVVFAAGNDARHLPEGQDLDAWLYEANHVAVPRLFAACREAGVKRAVQLGSFYFMTNPELIPTNSYVRSRLAACEGARSEGRPGFDVMSINAPFMVGDVPGLPSAIFEPYVQWAKGLIAVPTVAPPGGTNFMSFRSLSEAIEGALLRGEPGKAYLVGDENMSFRDYLQLFFDAVGNPVQLTVLDEPNLMLPDLAIYQGRGNTISYEPDPEETALLGYRRNDVRSGVREVVDHFA